MQTRLKTHLWRQTWHLQSFSEKRSKPWSLILFNYYREVKGSKNKTRCYNQCLCGFLSFSFSKAAVNAALGAHWNYTAGEASPSSKERTEKSHAGAPQPSPSCSCISPGIHHLTDTGAVSASEQTKENITVWTFYWGKGLGQQLLPKRRWCTSRHSQWLIHL